MVANEGGFAPVSGVCPMVKLRLFILWLAGRLGLVLKLVFRTINLLSLCVCVCVCACACVCV